MLCIYVCCYVYDIIIYKYIYIKYKHPLQILFKTKILEREID